MEMLDNNEAAIVFRGVNKSFMLFKNEKQRLHLLFRPRAYVREKRAVRNVSFVIRKGEAVALLGRNGAGKTTILKMVAGVAHPTSGLVRVNGRVSAMLGLSAGFDADLTGRENIYFRADILGIPKEDIAKREKAILAFAELGEYIDQPVRTYSSGMKARLGFAINAHINPEIIIVDEALSVGDKQFRKKCNQKIKEILEQKVTFLFVTHSAAEAQRFCKRGLVLQNGRIVCDDDISVAAAFYDAMLKQPVQKKSHRSGRKK